MNKKKVFFLSVQEKGYGTEEIILQQFFKKHRYLTIGNRYECDIIGNTFGDRQRLLEKRRSGYNLIIRPGMEGDITIEEKTVSLDWLIKFGHLKKRGKNYLFLLSDKSACILKIGDHALTFGQREVVSSERNAVKLDRSLRRPWIHKENLPFNAILFLYAVLYILSIHYLESITLKKKEPMEIFSKIPQRFAKLILQPPKKKVVKREILKLKPKEKEETKEDKDLKKEEPPPPETKPETKKEAVQIREEPSLPAEQEKASLPVEPEKAPPPIVAEVSLQPEPQEPLSSAAKKEIIREKVKHRGLLGVIMAKARPDENLDQGVFREIDKLVGKMEKDESKEREENILASLVVKSSETISKVQKDIIIAKPKRGKPRETVDIVKEKKDVSLKQGKTETEKENDIVIHQRSEGDVHKTIYKYVGGLKYLYNNALKNNSLLKGSITVKMIISSDGKIKKAEKVSTTLNYPALEKAIIKRIYKWRFPPIKNTVDYKVSYTFDFSPLG